MRNQLYTTVWSQKRKKQKEIMLDNSKDHSLLFQTRKLGIESQLIMVRNIEAPSLPILQRIYKRKSDKLSIAPRIWVRFCYINKKLKGD